MPDQVDTIDATLAAAMCALKEDDADAAADMLSWLDGQAALSEAQQLRLQLLRGLLLLQRDAFSEGLAIALPALQQAEARQQHQDLAWAFALTGFRLGFAGDPERGLSYLGKAQVLHADHDMVLNRILHWRGCLLSMAGQFAEAMVTLEQAIAVARQLCAPALQASSHNSLALTRLKQAEASERALDHAAMRVHAEAALAHARLGLDFAAAQPGVRCAHHYYPYLLRQQAQALTLLGEDVAARQILDSFLPDAREVPLRVGGLCTLARLQRRARAHDEARQTLAQAIQLARLHGDNFDLDAPLREAIELEAELGDWQTALSCARLHADFLERNFTARLQAVARHGELVVETMRLQLANQALVQSERHWQSQALRDGLTGLGNRVAMEQASERLWNSMQDFGTAIIDVDHFKRVNDEFGHAMGDAVLRELAALLERACRHDDVVARMGGEEFVLLLPQLKEAEALRACERVRQLVEQHAWNSLQPDLHVTISVGLAMRGGADCWHTQLARADQALYQAKHGGRNRVLLAH